MKKNFKGTTTSAVDKFISKPQTSPSAHKAHEAHYTHEAHSTPTTAGTYYRINLRLKPELEAHLKTASWENHLNVTQYINKVLDEDRVKRLKATKKEGQ